MLHFPSEQAKSLKDEGNAYFKEKKYDKAVVAYTAALQKYTEDPELNTVLLTNRAASHYYLGTDLFYLFLLYARSVYVFTASLTVIL